LQRLAALLTGAPVLSVSTLADENDEDEELDPSAEPDLVCLVPTSGSTGTVKFVMLNRNALLHRYFSQNFSRAALKVAILSIFPFEGVSGLGAVFLRYASLTQLHPRVLTARPLAIFESIERFAIALVQTTNSTAARLVEDAAKEERSFDLSSLKCSGSAVRP
jgi:acyl-coenzyme A synthetase/AMP-(fatty) acid ligase